MVDLPQCEDVTTTTPTTTSSSSSGGGGSSSSSSLPVASRALCNTAAQSLHKPAAASHSGDPSTTRQRNVNQQREAI